MNQNQNQNQNQNIHADQGSRETPLFRFRPPQPIASVDSNVTSQINLYETFFRQLVASGAQHYSNDPAAQANISFLRAKLANSERRIQDLVRINASVMHGNPVFEGTRIPVYRIIEELADGTSLRELKECFPSLTHEKVQAGLDFTIRLLRIYDD